MRFITPQDIEKKLVELEEGVKKERIAMNELNFIVTQMIFDYGQKPQIKPKGTYLCHSEKATSFSYSP